MRILKSLLRILALIAGVVAIFTVGFAAGVITCEEARIEGSGQLQWQLQLRERKET